MLDHNAKKMRIHKTNDPFSEYKLFLYSEIKEIEEFNEANSNHKSAIQERWSFKFGIKTAKRDFILYAPSADEKALWMHTFTFITRNNANY